MWPSAGILQRNSLRSQRAYRSETGAITVITSESQHYLRCSPLSQAGERVASAVECSYLVLSFTSFSSAFTLFEHVCLLLSSLFLSFLTFMSPTMNSDPPHPPPTPPSVKANVRPHLVLCVKQNLFQWDGNQMKGNHAVTVQLLIVPPHPTPFIDCEPQQDRCSVCMLPALPPSIFLPGIPDYCSICLIVVSECLLFVCCGVLEVCASI